MLLLGKMASFKGHLLFINIAVIMDFTKVRKFCINSRCRQGLFLRPIRTELFVGACLCCKRENWGRAAPKSQLRMYKARPGVGGILVHCKTHLQVPDSRVRAWSQ